MGRIAVRVGLVIVSLTVPMLLRDAAFAHAVHHCVDALRGPDREAWTRARARLAKVERDAIPLVIESFAEQHEGAGREARRRMRIARTVLMDVLRGLSRERVIPALVAALHQQDPDIQHHACMTLAYIGEQAVGALVETLREDPSAQVRASAAWTLSMIGGVAQPAKEALRAALDDDSMEVRYTARYALYHIEHLEQGFSQAVERARRMTTEPR